jgi:hypothetical protein
MGARAARAFGSARTLLLIAAKHPQALLDVA